MLKDEKRGLYRKFVVTRSDDPEGKHEHCYCFVLDLTHDEFAPAAMKAYGRKRPLAKYEVQRTHDPDGKHDLCRYVVLDLTSKLGRTLHDERAADALRAYASACAAKYPVLALDLRALVHGDRTPLRKIRRSVAPGPGR